jgi:hypothetical protein
MTGTPEHRFAVLPDQRNYEISYNLAFKLAGEKLSGLPDLQEQCRKSESTCLDDPPRRIILKYLNRAYQVSLPEITVTVQNSGEKVELRDQVLILHYFTRANGTPLARNLITFQELKDAVNYYPSFTKRAITPLLDYFGSNPDKLVELSRELGGYEVDYGDIAVTVPAFSRVPITLVLWKGDSEFPPNANILFDSTILDYLSAEDVSVICQTVVWQLVKSLKRISDTPGPDIKSK